VTVSSISAVVVSFGDLSPELKQKAADLNITAYTSAEFRALVSSLSETAPAEATFACHLEGRAF
jgi:hypothetical protein